MKTEGKMAVGRRQFLFSVGAAAAATTAAGQLVTEARADTETGEEKRKSRYKLTDHIKNYYRVNHYPASRK